MSLMEYGSMKFEVDDEGYLLNTDDWNEQVACALAEKEGVDELTADRMDIIKFLRDHYRRYRFFPLLGAVCKNLHKPRECVTEQFMDHLKAWKVAGLPKPDEHLIAYLKGEGGIV